MGCYERQDFSIKDCKWQAGQNPHHKDTENTKIHFKKFNVIVLLAISGLIDPIQFLRHTPAGFMHMSFDAQVILIRPVTIYC